MEATSVTGLARVLACTVSGETDSPSLTFLKFLKHTLLHNETELLFACNFPDEVVDAEDDDGDEGDDDNDGKAAEAQQN